MRTNPALCGQKRYQFYEIIAKRKKEFGDKPFVPPTDSWYFQFSPTETFLDSKIEPDDLSIVSTFSFPKTGRGKASGSITVTLKPILSIVYESRNINRETQSDVECRGKDAFSYPFDKTSSFIWPLLPMPKSMSKP